VISKLLLAWSLMALCVAIHAMGVTAALRWWGPRTPRGYWGWTSTLTLVAGWMILLHLLEIILWGVVYAAASAMPDLQTAAYFSAVTYTTTGYGDLTLPAEWRLVGGIEALTGILMCGLSTGFFVAVVSRMLQSIKQDTKPA
jgi:hypothetical protein